MSADYLPTYATYSEPQRSKDTDLEDLWDPHLYYIVYYIFEHYWGFPLHYRIQDLDNFVLYYHTIAIYYRYEDPWGLAIYYRVEYLWGPTLYYSDVDLWDSVLYNID